MVDFHIWGGGGNRVFFLFFFLFIKLSYQRTRQDKTKPTNSDSVVDDSLYVEQI